MKKAVNNRVAVFLAAALCLGIAAGAYGRLHLSAVLWIAVALGASVALAGLALMAMPQQNKRLPCKKHTVKKPLLIRRAFNTSISFLQPHRVQLFATAVFFLLGCMGFTLALGARQAAEVPEGSYAFEGRVTEVFVRDYGVSYSLDKVVLFDGETQLNLKGGLMLTLSGDGQEIIFGDVLSGVCSIKNRPVVYEGAVNTYSVRHRTPYSGAASFEYIEIEKEAGLSPLLAVKKHIFFLLQSKITPGIFPIAYALVLGNTSFISEEVMGGYRSTGIAHIFSVSGLHISFLAVALSALLKAMGLRPRLRLAAVSAVLLLYSALCGFAPSVLRAAIMGVTLMSAHSFHKKYDGLTALALSAVVVLAIEPLFLFDAGFLMSYASVAGIILLTPQLMKLLNFLPSRFSLPICATLGAQLGLFPVLIFFYSNVPALALIANLVVVPVVTAAFLVLMALVVVCALLPFLSFLLSAAQFLLEVADALTIIIDRAATANLQIYYVSGFALLFYIFVAVWSGKIMLGSKTKICVSAVSLALSVCILLIQLVPFSRPESVIALKGEGDFFVLSAGAEIVLVDSSYQETDFSFLPELLRKGRIKTVDKVILCHGHTGSSAALEQAGLSAPGRTEVILPERQYHEGGGRLLELRGYTVIPAPEGHIIHSGEADYYFAGNAGIGYGLYVRLAGRGLLFVAGMNSAGIDSLASSFIYPVDVLFGGGNLQALCRGRDSGLWIGKGLVNEQYEGNVIKKDLRLTGSLIFYFEDDIIRTAAF